MQQEEGRMLTVKEVSGLVGVSVGGVYDMIQRGDFPIPHVRVGKRIRFSPTLVVRFVRGEES